VETSPGWNVLSAACPTRQVLDRVADKWTMLVILALQESGTLRFSQLRREVEGITQKMLTQTLRGLERDGMLTRTVVATVPVTVSYTLTDLGHRLSSAVAVLRQWSYENISDIDTARAHYDTRTAQRGAI
jgi:DNA-binding HxlR family transcriptional regulator